MNLGTGTGYSVLDIVRAFEQASGQSVPYKIAPRRPGDIASCYADPQRALELLGWRAERGIGAMCADAWRWQSGNPDGYTGSFVTLMLNKFAGVIDRGWRRIGRRVENGSLPPRDRSILAHQTPLTV